MIKFISTLYVEGNILAFAENGDVYRFLYDHQHDDGQWSMVAYGPHRIKLFPPSQT